MSIQFKNILIPVDFSVNTEIAVKKGLELIETNDSIIHLVHIITSGERETGYKKLNEWQASIQEKIPGLTVEIHLFKGLNVQHHIVTLAKKLLPQMIIIGKHNYHNWFSFLNTIDPDKLGRLTSCPVLTVKMGSLRNRVKSIVFPVKCFVPNRKIDMLITIARKYRARVYLVILVNPVNEQPTPLYTAFIDTYRLLKASLNCPVEHTMVTGNNLAKASLDFAHSINADMILVSPETETRISLLTGKQVNDVIKGDSKLEILSVEPAITGFLN
ncbi:MAG: universal stress protein [Bacteroidota bacterium]